MRQVLRARIVLAAPAGQSNAGIARALAITADTARKWRKRFCGNGIDGLIDLPRSGRPRTFTAEQVAEVKAARALDLYARIWDTNHSARTTTCSPLMRNQVSRHVTASAAGSGPRLGGR